MTDPASERHRTAAVRRDRRPWLGVLLIVLYVLASDLANVELGRTDNGDFTRLVQHWVAKPVGFAINWPPNDDPAYERRFFNCFHPVWERQPASSTRPAVAWDAGSANLVWAPAFALAQAFRNDGRVDVRIFGAVLRGLRLLALLGLYGVLVRLCRGRSAWWPLAVVAPCVLALTDPRAATYCNSFFREGATLLYAPGLITALLAFAVVPPGWAIVLFTVATALVAGSATAHVPLALLGAIGLPLAVVAGTRGAPGRAGSRRLAVAGAVATLLAIALLLPKATPDWVRSNVAFQALFRGALLVSDDPARAVTELGLPAEAQALIGRNAFEPDSQPFRKAHGARVDHALIAELVWRHPTIGWRLLSQAADDVWGGDHAFVYVADAACVPRLPAGAWWTWLKHLVAPRGPRMLGLLGLAAAAGIWRARRLQRDSVPAIALAFTALAALAEIAATVLGNGLHDLGRHVITASFFADATLGLAILQLAGPLRTPTE